MQKALIVFLVLAVVGCKSATSPEGKARVVTPTASGHLSFNLPNFHTLDELKSWFGGQVLTRRIYHFEKEGLEAVVVAAEWGHGDSWDALYLYAPGGYSKEWTARGLWNAETRNVEVTFNEQTGMINVRSGKGMTIFSANIAALDTPASRDW
jgi:hypothetical protein